MIKKSCKWCGKTFMTKSTRRRYCNKTCEMMAKENKKIIPGQLCWSCKNTNGNACSWFSKEMKPVKGWTAKATTSIDAETGKVIHSYRILKCPQFEKGRVR